jgi:nitrite reductase/ring-hydroxylating ferredoxin subunit
MNTMKIKLLKGLPIEKAWHEEGETVDCEQQRAKYLVKQGAAVALEADPEADEDDPADEPVEDPKPENRGKSMKIQLLKGALIEKTWHEQGETVECDEVRAKYLVKNGVAVKVTTTGPAKAENPPVPVKREAVQVPAPKPATPKVDS